MGREDSSRKSLSPSLSQGHDHVYDYCVMTQHLLVVSHFVGPPSVESIERSALITAGSEGLCCSCDYLDAATNMQRARQRLPMDSLCWLNQHPVRSKVILDHSSNRKARYSRDIASHGTESAILTELCGVHHSISTANIQQIFSCRQEAIPDQAAPDTLQPRAHIWNGGISSTERVRTSI